MYNPYVLISFFSKIQLKYNLDRTCFPMCWFGLPWNQHIGKEIPYTCGPYLFPYVLVWGVWYKNAPKTTEFAIWTLVSDTCFGFRAVHPFAWTPGSEGLSSESWLGTSGFGWWLVERHFHNESSFWARLCCLGSELMIELHPHSKTWPSSGAPPKKKSI